MIAASEPHLIREADELSAEHQGWCKHRDLLLHIQARDVGYRGCLGLALVLRPGNEDVSVGECLFIRDSHVAWAALQDIPVRRMPMSARREVHYASLRTTAVKHGMPTLGRETVLSNWDFRSMPRDSSLRDGRTVTPPRDVLRPSEQPQLFRVFNRLNWAMTSTAFMSRSAWRPQRHFLFDAVGQPFHQDARLLLFGDGLKCEALPGPSAWMPRPYLAFPASRQRELWALATRRGLAGEQPYYPRSLRRQFCDDLSAGLPVRVPVDGRFTGMSEESHDGFPVTLLHFDTEGETGETVVRVSRHVRLEIHPGQLLHAGDVVARDAPPLPQRWEKVSPCHRWDRVLSAWPAREKLDGFLRVWFERQVVHLKPGFVHLPSDLACVAAMEAAVDAELYWDVTPALPYFAESCDAFILQTLRINGWDDWRGVLPGEIAFDFNPAADSGRSSARGGKQESNRALASARSA